ncbi:MAG: hypothetical protein KGI29_07745 [Pseudomonadota bacterium]|nr:hypothetical protein [Pseudomonadota bacterium]MDE3037268.1 hypothetical protein [Pseudomonadota bacterium]
MPPIQPDHFKRKPGAILNRLCGLKIGAKDADFLTYLWCEWDRWRPDNSDQNPFSGDSLHSRKKLEQEFGSRRFAEQIKDFYDVLFDARKKKNQLQKLTDGEKKALQEGIEIVLPALYKEAARVSKLSGKISADNSALRKKLKADESPDTGGIEDLILQIGRAVHSDLSDDEILKRAVKFSTRDSSNAEQEKAFLKEAGKLTLQLCGSLQIRIKDSARNFFHSDEITL